MLYRRYETGWTRVGSSNAGSHSYDGGRAGTGRGAPIIGGCLVWLSSHDDLQVADCGIAAGCGGEGAALQAGDRAATQFDAGSGATGVSLDQWPGPASVWSGFRIVDAICGRRPDRAETRRPAWRDRGGGIACQAGTDGAKGAAASVPARSGSD